MIRDFILGDEAKLKANEFSDPSDIQDVFTNDGYHKYTLEDAGEVKVIACWGQYQEGKWAAFFLMSDGITMSHVRELKSMISEAVGKLKPQSVITYSVDCDMLNRWHEFLGFQKNDSDQVLVDGKLMNKWVMSWDGKLLH